MTSIKEFFQSKASSSTKEKYQTQKEGDREQTKTLHPFFSGPVKPLVPEHPTSSSSSSFGTPKKRTTKSQIENDRFLVRDLPTWLTASETAEIRAENPWIQEFYEGCPPERLSRLRIYILPRGCVLLHLPHYMPTEQEKELYDELDALEMKEGKIFNTPTPRAMSWMVNQYDDKLQGAKYFDHYEFDKDQEEKERRGKSHSIVPGVRVLMNQLNHHFGFDYQREREVAAAAREEEEKKTERKDKGKRAETTKKNKAQPTPSYLLNSVLINKYRKDKIIDPETGKWLRGGGKESIADHRDKEYLFNGRKANIISISLGQRRKFVIRYLAAEDVPLNAPTPGGRGGGGGGVKRDRGEALHRLEFPLGEGDLFVMGGNTNQYCTHGIPKEPELPVTRHRFSLTFRSILVLPVPTRSQANYYGSWTSTSASPAPSIASSSPRNSG